MMKRAYLALIPLLLFTAEAFAVLTLQETMPYPGMAMHMELHGDTLYGLGETTFVVYDLEQDPPQAEHVYFPSDDLRSFLVNNDVAYVAAGFEGLYVVQLTQDGPALVNTLQLPGDATGLEILDDGSLLLSVDYSGWLLLDINNDPINPTINHYLQPLQDNQQPYTCGLFEMVGDVLINGDGNGWNFSNPISPQLLPEIPGEFSMTIQGIYYYDDYVFMTGGDFVGSDNYDDFFTGNYSILDVSDPFNASVLAQDGWMYSTNQGRIKRDITANDQWMFISNWKTGSGDNTQFSLAVFNIINHEVPVLVETHEINSGGLVRNGTTLYVSTPGELNVYSISDDIAISSQTPSTESSIVIDDFENNAIEQHHHEESTVNRQDDYKSNVSELDEVIFIEHTVLDGFADVAAMYQYGPVLYIAFTDGPLKAYDTSNPETPMFMTETGDIQGTVDALHVHEDQNGNPIALYAQTNEYLFVFDGSDPFNPELMNTILPDDEFYGNLDSRGVLLFVGDEVFNISDPFEPVPATNLPPGVYVLHAFDQFIAADYDGISLYELDVLDYPYLSKRLQLDSEDYIRSATWQGQRLFVSTQRYYGAGAFAWSIYSLDLTLPYRPLISDIHNSIRRIDLLDSPADSLLLYSINHYEYETVGLNALTISPDGHFEPSAAEWEQISAEAIMDLTTFASYVYMALNNHLYILEMVDPTEVEQSTGFTLPHSGFQLFPAWPNPFNARTTATLNLSVSGHVEVMLYDVLGRHVSTLADRQLRAGTHTITIDGSNLSSGTYFLRAAFDGYGVQSQRLTLVQ